MPINEQGIGTYANSSAQVRNDISVVSIGWYINRCPLVTRLPRLPVGSTRFDMISRKFNRPRTTTLGGAIADGSTTSVTLTDASTFMVGDVLEIGTERLQITAIAANVLTVVRAVEGTSGASALNGATVTLIGNSRSGGEVDQDASTYIPSAVAQYTQTFQFPVQVSGTVMATTEMQLPGGVRTPFDQDRMEALQNLMDDIEYTSYYGKGDSGSSTGKPKQKGLKTLLTTNSTTSPTNAAAYKPEDLVRDTILKCTASGGDPDVLLLSTNWQQGFTAWGQQLQVLDAGSTVLGVPIRAFTAPFLNGDVTCVLAPLLPSGTAICLTSHEIRMRAKRNEFWSPRGIRGDAIEGDWIAEMAIEIMNEGHHAWLEGVTGFSPA